MHKKFSMFLVLISFVGAARDCNLVMIIDNLHKETAKTEEINMTHQCITALQQRVSAVLVSGTIWKNIIDRKHAFEKRLQDADSLESAIVQMYQKTNQELQAARYNLAMINQKLSQAWFAEQYPQLAALSPEKCNQLRFDFLCYTFEFDQNQWRVYNPHEGMLLFVPQELGYQIDGSYLVQDDRALFKHAEKKSYPVESMKKLLPASNDRWVIYLAGHGHPKSSQQGANIAGLKIDEFASLLQFLNEALQLKLLVYSSCYGGGVHTVEPYENLKLHYPVIVTALTDAPIFGFGLFEGVKLPPYDAQFKLQTQDVIKNKGLAPVAIQNFSAFFKRAWKGQLDLNLVQAISRFFTCDLMLCHVQKVENFPLIRKAGEIIFVPMRDTTMLKLVQQIATNSSITVNKPLLIYTKKIKKIKMDACMPIVSMLPGLQSHLIEQLLAPHLLFSQILSQVLFSLEDMQSYKNFMIHKLTCLYDGAEPAKSETLTNVVVLAQHQVRPKFFHKSADALIYFQRVGKYYLAVWNDRKIAEIIELDQEQIETMQDIINYVQQAINFDQNNGASQLLTFDAYVDNKEHQQQVVDACVKNKVCKK